MTDDTRRRTDAACDFFLDLAGSSVAGAGLDAYLSVFEARVGTQPGQRVTAVTADRATILRGGAHYRVPDGTHPLAHALDLAHSDYRGLMIITGAWIPDSGAMRSLVDLADIDPNVGMIQPRFAVGASGDLLIPGKCDASASLIPRELQSMLPEFHVTPEIDAACVYVCPQGVTACGQVRADAGQTALAELLVSIRRRGFRNVIANRVAVDYPLPRSTAYRLLESAVDPTLMEDLRAGEAWLERSSAVKFERLLSGGMTGDRKRLLLDCRGMTPAHNGSAHAILGYLTGIEQLRPKGWEITICVGRDAAAFHELTRRFPDFVCEYGQPTAKYLVAIHLSQPWWLAMMRDLHDSAPILAFNILDTIAWDSIYSAPTELDEVTRLAARFADGLTYISEHSRQRFHFRFSTHDRMREAVTYLSTSPFDYGSDGADHARAGVGILVVGNRLDHKDVARTADTLTDAFPFSQVIAFGSAGGQERPNLRAVPSGFMSDADVRDLLERATVIVYPSFTEGFGIPVVQGLALGKAVVVRDLPLWSEIRRRTRPGGQLHTYRTDAELVDAVGRALEKREPITSALDVDEPVEWIACANTLIGFADDLVQHFSFDQWQSRELALAREWSPRIG